MSMLCMRTSLSTQECCHPTRATNKGVPVSLLRFCPIGTDFEMAARASCEKLPPLPPRHRVTTVEAPDLLDLTHLSHHVSEASDLANHPSREDSLSLQASGADVDSDCLRLVLRDELANIILEIRTCISQEISHAFALSRHGSADREIKKQSSETNGEMPMTLTHSRTVPIVATTHDEHASAKSQASPTTVEALEKQFGEIKSRLDAKYEKHAWVGRPMKHWSGSMSRAKSKLKTQSMLKKLHQRQSDAGGDKERENFKERKATKGTKFFVRQQSLKIKHALKSKVRAMVDAQKISRVLQGSREESTTVAPFQEKSSTKLTLEPSWRQEQITRASIAQHKKQTIIGDDVLVPVMLPGSSIVSGLNAVPEGPKLQNGNGTCASLESDAQATDCARESFFSVCSGDEGGSGGKKSESEGSVYDDWLGTTTRLYVPHGRLASLVCSSQFDLVIAILVFINALAIGIQTDWVTRNTSEDLPRSFRILEVAFCVIFTVELILRILVYRIHLFYMPGWEWNVFDLIIVGLQLSEELLTALVGGTGGEMPSFSAMRVLRILRLIRIVRLVRIMRLIGELRTLVTSITSSMRCLLWTLVLISVTIYMVSVFFLQVVSDHLLTQMEENNGVPGEGSDGLLKFFGGLDRAVLSLFQSITGGVNWRDLMVPLRDEISPVLTWILALYIAFAVLAMLNVVTGVFVETAMTRTKEQNDIFTVNNVRALFDKDTSDPNANQTMTMQDFEDHLGQQKMLDYFHSIDLDPSEARALFSLIDVDNSGEIDAEEFLNGCLRLRGPAKSIDLQVLLREVGRLSELFMDHARYMELVTHQNQKNEDPDSFHADAPTVARGRRIQVSNRAVSVRQQAARPKVSVF